MSAPSAVDVAQPACETSDCLAARRLTLTGQVQGIGLRPAIVRLGLSLQLVGRVYNCPTGVVIDMEGPPSQLDEFTARLPEVVPRRGRLACVRTAAMPRAGFVGWQIGGAHDGGPLEVPVPRDQAVCQECLDEIAQSDDTRRTGYAFTSCTHCGPRYSVIRHLPYARKHTAWAAFSMCHNCGCEFENPADRRFHAELNGCSRCGPRVRLMDCHGKLVGESWRTAVTQALWQGQTVALLGIGGYQLLCDATHRGAIAALRRRKVRASKPLAVLVTDLAAAHRLAYLDDAEVAALTDPANPIVIVRCRGDAALASAELQPGLRELGLMLPATPLHWMVARDAGRPLVCTSANLEGDPLLYRCGDNSSRTHLADLWLEHDRDVVRPIDDSVVRVLAGRIVTLRLGRGLAPLPLELPVTLLQCPPALALGGHQKASLAWHNGSQAALGPHIGDLDSLATYQRYQEHLASCQQLYQFAPQSWLADMHPDYASTRWALSNDFLPRAIQHHHAHVASAIVEHGRWNETVLGVAWDGSGYGLDGTVWGGEFLVASLTRCRRMARLRPIPLLGGAAAIRQPARVAVALLHATFGAVPGGPQVAGLDSATAGAWRSLLARSSFTLLASSVGRLFDGVAALALADPSEYDEGYLAMRLECLADPTTRGEYPLPFRTTSANEPGEVDWRPLVRAVWHDVCQGEMPGAISMRFHRALASAVLAVARDCPRLPIALTGGVFQNRLLTELICDRFAAQGQFDRLLLPGLIPPGDGGLAAGQLAIGLATQASQTHPTATKA